MKKKAIAGILAFICTVNMLAVSGESSNNTGMFSGISITTSAESETIPSHVSSIGDYYNNAYYSHDISEETDEDSRWKVGSYTYGIITDTISHEEGTTSVVDAKITRVALVGVDSTARLTSVKPYTSVKIGEEAGKLITNNELDVLDKTHCTAIGESVFENGGQYLKDIDLTGIKMIGSRAFASCKYITIVDIPASVESMGEGIFADSGLKTVTMNNKFTKIPNTTFMNAPLGKITFANQDIICEIGESAFENTTLTSYPLTNSDQYVAIDNSAFSGCKQLATLALPNNVVIVGDNAFEDCTAIKSLTTGSNCGLLGHGAFAGCASLTSIKFNDGLKYIGAGAFKNCTSLVNGPEMPDSLSFKAFGTGIETYEIGEGLLAENTKEYVGYSVYADGESTCEGIFEGCTALKTVHLPSTADTIPEGYCKGCTSLTSVTFGTNVINIYDEAFSGCVNLQDIVLANIQGYIGRNAFNSCTALKAMFSKNIAVINDYAFSGCTSLKSFDVTAKACLHHVFDGCTGLTDVSLKASTWGAYIFANCTNLQSAFIYLSGAVSTPDGIFYNCEKLSDLKNTDFSTVQIIGADAFTNCKALKSLSLPKVVIVDSNAFSGCSSLTKICSGAITIQDYGDYSFYGCTNLTQDVNSKVSTIGESAFEESGIKSLTIDGTVGNTLVINNNAFKNCDKLQYAKINIEDTSIEYEIGNNIFESCDKMSTIEYSGTELPVGFIKDCNTIETVKIPRVQDVREEAFSGCKALKEITGVTTFKSIGNGAFSGCESISKTYADAKTVYSGEGQYARCTALKEATVYDITPSMFEECSALKTVKLANNISTVDAFAFNGCTSLDTINLDNIKYFEENSFSNAGIYKLELTSANTIGDSAFANCSDLHTINVEVDTIGESAFSGCGVLSKADIVANTIGSNAFYDCSSLYLVSFPETSGYSLIDIGSTAFYGTMLSDVLIPDTVLNIGSSAFGYGSSSVPVDEFTIYGTKGTIAEEYANENEIKFLDKSKYSVDGILKKKHKPGDVNCDGVVSVVDAVLLQRWLLCAEVSGIYGPNMDLNNDGVVNVFDMCIEKKILLDQIAAEETVEDTTDGIE